MVDVDLQLGRSRLQVGMSQLSLEVVERDAKVEGSDRIKTPQSVRSDHVEGLAVLMAPVSPFRHNPPGFAALWRIRRWHIGLTYLLHIPGSCPRKLHPLDPKKAPSEIRREERGIPTMPALNLLIVFMVQNCLISKKYISNRFSC